MVRGQQGGDQTNPRTGGRPRERKRKRKKEKREETREENIKRDRGQGDFASGLNESPNGTAGSPALRRMGKPPMGRGPWIHDCLRLAPAPSEGGFASDGLG